MVQSVARKYHSRSVSRPITTQSYKSTPFYLREFQGSYKVKNARGVLLGLKTAYELQILHAQFTLTNQFNGSHKEQIIKGYKSRLNEIKRLLEVVDLCQ